MIYMSAADGSEKSVPVATTYDLPDPAGVRSLAAKRRTSGHRPIWTGPETHPWAVRASDATHDNCCHAGDLHRESVDVVRLTGSSNASPAPGAAFRDRPGA
jgi:hypothetical protein